MRLVPLRPEEFEAWAERSRRGFADQQARSGSMPAADARAYAGRQLAALLPHGSATPGHHLWTLVAAGEAVGSLWLAIGHRPGGPEAYLYEIELDPAARGRGLGRAAMLAAEDAARSLGATRMRLNVFGHNAVAAGLYEDLGYAVVETVLTVRLDPAARTPYEPGGVTLDRPAQVNPGHERWTGRHGGTVVGSVCLHLSRRSDGTHAEVHDLVVDDHGPEVLAAVQRLAAERGAVALAVSVAGGDAGLLGLCRRSGLTVTAQLREKPLSG